ncbi:MAG TPA: hypothetical protein ENK57_26460 [Polyangiaceae bacterium]|nr:hypothetical protein [Polyangiaceae bacterium]
MRRPRPIPIPLTGRILRWSGDDAVANMRGRLVIKPRPGDAIDVRVVNDLGGSIVELKAHAAESTLVDLPLDSMPRHLRQRPKPGSKLVTVPGALWFYAREPVAELGFLTDANAGAYTAKLAVERPRDGNPFDNDEREAPSDDP